MGRIKHVTAFVIFSASIFLIYFNSLEASWHLDDYQNIIQDAHIHLTDGDLASIIEYVKSVQLVGRDARPLSRFSFAVNWYFGRNDPFGYHLVNIIIHIFSSFFVYGTILSILRTPNFQFVLSDRNYYKTSLLAALLWAINPIQTQAITYIVQRMAALAAMFYILAIYLYIKARTSDNSAKTNLLFFSCLLSTVCAFASKENAATLPIALLLVEFLFFQDLSRKKMLNIFWGVAITAGLVMAGLGVVIFFKGDFQGLLNYNFRYFSPVERLLTEPRVVLYYLSQIFYPVPTRLSIEHDIVASKSLFSPWTTLPAIILVCSLIGIGLYNIRRRPMVGFAVLFFFLNHVIESSVIGLELVFEHRNYLPSFFLFGPVAAGIVGLLDYYREKNKLIHHAIITFVVLIIAGFGAGTYIRNLVWQSEKSLWEDAVVKAPNSGRAWHNLALSYYERQGRSDVAMVLYRKALNLAKNNTKQESVILGNIAANYYRRGAFQEAADAWQRAFESNPRNLKNRYYRSLALIKLGDLDEASIILDETAAKRPDLLEPLNTKGLVLLAQGEYDQALPYFRRCLAKKESRATAIINTGAAFSLMGDYTRADIYLKTSLSGRPIDINALLWLARNSLQDGDIREANRYIDQMLTVFGTDKLLSHLKIIQGQRIYADTVYAPPVDGMLLEHLQSRADGKRSRSKHSATVAAEN